MICFCVNAEKSSKMRKANSAVDVRTFKSFLKSKETYRAMTDTCSQSHFEM